MNYISSLISNNLHIIFETVSNGYFTEALNFFSIIVIFSGIVVIISKNPIYSVIFLIILFIFIALHLILSGFSFIGLSYIIVYVGAVSILILFILMLINIRISELKNYTNNSIALCIIIGIYLHFILSIISSYNIGVEEVFNNSNYYIVINNYLEFIFSYFINFVDILKSIISNITKGDLVFVSSNSWDANIATDNSHITSIGNIMYANYSLLILKVSLILLLVMVGSIIIAINPQSSLKQPHTFRSLSLLHSSFLILPKGVLGCSKRPF